MNFLVFIVCLVFSYLLGSIQGSYISSRYIYNDIKVVSEWQEYKTIHTFNKERISVIIIDGVKIFIPTLFLFLSAPLFSLEPRFAALLGGGSATLGHMYPFFRLGKGEAMEAFMITALFVSLPSALISILIFCALFVVFGRKTIPFVVSVFAFPVVLFIFFRPTFEVGILSILYSILIFWRQKRAVNTFLSE